MNQSSDSVNLSAESRDPLVLILRDWLIAFAVFALIACLGCNSVSDEVRSAVRHDVSDWVQISKSPPKYIPPWLPKGTKRNRATDDWIIADGNRYLVPTQMPEGVPFSREELIAQLRNLRNKEEIAEDERREREYDRESTLEFIATPVTWCKACS